RLSAGSSGETRRGCPADTPEPGGRPAGVVPAWRVPEADGGAAWCPGLLVAGASRGAGAGSVGRRSRVALDPGVESDADRVSAGPAPWGGEDADWLPAGVVPDSGVGGTVDGLPAGVVGAWKAPDAAGLSAGVVPDSAWLPGGVGDVRGGGAGRPAARGTAALAAYCSRQPRAPQEPGGASGWTGMWPRSPARPRAP